MQPQPGGGLKFALFGLSQFSGAEVDDDDTVLTHHGEAFAVDNDGRGLTDVHAEEGMGEGILNVGLFQVLLGKWAAQFGYCKASSYRSIASTRASSFLIFFVKSGSLGSATIYLFH